MSMADCNTTCSAAERRQIYTNERLEAHLNLQGDFAIVGRINWSECALQVQRLSKKRRCEISVWRCEVRMIERIDRVHAQCQMIFHQRGATLSRRRCIRARRW